ncbi:GNAT family N-acetyltransferase [Deinococcus hopiensis]|uniref:Acetyltransferases n=1 Tax=Deinococcus hopiensis KR-140 TaxID=695939 RepID=A0A1W1UDU5_9DEIO|nr:GNAT family N-acetyltransferase [Deinococcus hopiensis]SMB79265.1 Acetyltransferases [Deinococcus hopiensis KR-140]
MGASLIRPALPGDGAALEEICVQTGLAGKDARAAYAHPERLAWLYVRPYLRLEPEGAFVLEDAQGVCGYVLTVHDTARYEAARLRVLPPVPDTPDLPTADAALAQQLRFPGVTPAALLAGWPAHLHLNLLPRAQGQGAGGRLLRHALGHLWRVGVHLGVDPSNARAAHFYAGHGFRSWQSEPGVTWMTRDRQDRRTSKEPL